MERETKTLETPAGKQLVVRSYLTARETMPIFSDTAKTNTDRAHGLAVATVVSYDGKTDDLDNTLLDLPLSEYTFVLNTAKQIAEGDFQTAK